MKFTDILVHYNEIATKGRNRKKFVEALERNIRQVMKGLPVFKIKRPPGRIWISCLLGEHFDQTALDRLARVYGISSYSPIVRTKLDLESMKEVAWECHGTAGPRNQRVERSGEERGEERGERREGRGERKEEE